MYKRSKKTTVQLTSLLDLLFVMIFVSLMQQKAQDIPTPAKKTAAAAPTVQKVEPKPVKPAKVKYSLQAVFTFSATPSNPKIPTGSYLMAGTYNSETGAIRLGGMSWINRPKNYDMVPLSGEMKPSIGLFRGRIEFQGCKTFTLKRQGTANGTPVAGKWVGTYDCQQGETALTLEIE